MQWSKINFQLSEKEARLRDCNDEIVQTMVEYADREKINTTLRNSLQGYAGYLSAVEDYRNTLITRIESLVLEPLAKYGEVMKLKKQAVQKAINARDKGVQRQRKLQQTRTRDPNNRDAIVTMQVQSEYAQTESSRADRVVQDEIDKFEELKLNDMKKLLTDFTLVHLAFHARALEMYTNAHQNLLNIDVAHDLEEFRTTAPFRRLQPSQRSVSDNALNKRTDNRLVDRREGEFGSRHSLPADNTYMTRTGSGGHRKQHSPIHEHGKRPTTASTGPKGKISHDSYSSDSDSTQE
ncbi:unnamed protein product [Didymodactylos carnosus]|uniref:Uncharacterized protein n=1 Tax=Didymodactylos carnosus TaxID=1234261 RepID=A0A813UHX5_9BILA|nr:unnamed protein product [Didymodactylos carnosus]CAF1087944.1 unnamed protein product [Didymodactylos carnosus]CAF3610268.1 unnamed protein product [Didymodactylos carnosus]CAF3849724.1 unnamed protein product [Didymodactylos carnosus]